jgi:hypothetical protein
MGKDKGQSSKDARRDQTAAVRNAGEIEKQLKAAIAARDAADESGKTFLPATDLVISRCVRQSSVDRVVIQLPNGQHLACRSIDDARARIVTEVCKACQKIQPGSPEWPFFMVSLPDPHASKPVGEIIAVVFKSPTHDQLTQFEGLVTIVGAEAEKDAAFVFTDEPDEEEVNIDAL